MALMVGIGHGFEKFGIAPWPADILGRAATFGREQTRIDYLGFGRVNSLQLNGVLPVVAEVVDVFERVVAGLRQELGQGCLACRAAARSEEIPIGIGNAVGDVAPDAELVEVIIFPAHDDLKDLVQAVEADRQRHLDTPAHRRFHVVESDRKPRDLISGHAARVAERGDKFQGNRPAMRLIGNSAEHLAVPITFTGMRSLLVGSPGIPIEIEPYQPDREDDPDRLREARIAELQRRACRKFEELTACEAYGRLCPLLSGGGP
jgi:hypothetical protein